MYHTHWGACLQDFRAFAAEANPGINTTIKDKYFNSAAATPAQIFPLLLNLAQKHLRKLANEGHKALF